MVSATGFGVFSASAARGARVRNHPQQHQLLLGVAATRAAGWATISELSEFMQGRHNAWWGWFQAPEERGLVRKVQGENDRRFVKVHLTRKGYSILDKISRKNIAELRALQLEIMNTPQSRPRDIPACSGH